MNTIISIDMRPQIDTNKSYHTESANLHIRTTQVEHQHHNTSKTDGPYSDTWGRFYGNRLYTCPERIACTDDLSLQYPHSLRGRQGLSGACKRIQHKFSETGSEFFYQRVKENR